ncbi:beta-N-acetylhexosaminidase [Gammaproteobacteria bacterium]|nr:beta-N-acetylhexosaminidase [Gammaproteobacteria bacterium]
MMMANLPGPLVVDVAGEELSSDERKLLALPSVAGLILFTRNYRNPQQVSALISEARASRSAPLLVMADHEGGRVQRFRPGFSELPSLAHYGALYQRQPERAMRLAAEHARVSARELAAVGVDLALAPVVDRDIGCSSVIGDRAFGGDVAAIIALSGAMIDASLEEGMTPVLKHFPGHGAVQADTHLSDAIDPRPMSAIATSDLPPFRAHFHKPIAVMSAHVTFSQVDANPTSFSRRWLKDVLRQSYGFQGLVLSDDLSMHAAASWGSAEDRVRAAIDAGCDLALLCNAGFTDTLNTAQRLADDPPPAAGDWRTLRLA